MTQELQVMIPLFVRGLFGGSLKTLTVSVDVQVLAFTLKSRYHFSQVPLLKVSTWKASIVTVSKPQRPWRVTWLH